VEDIGVLTTFVPAARQELEKLGKYVDVVEHMRDEAIQASLDG
jgi:hypothetical protein